MKRTFVIFLSILSNSHLVYARYDDYIYEEGSGDWSLFIAVTIFWIIILYAIRLSGLSEEKIDSIILNLSKIIGTILGSYIFFLASNSGTIGGIIGGILGGIFFGFFSFVILNLIGGIVASFTAKK